MPFPPFSDCITSSNSNSYKNIMMKKLSCKLKSEEVTYCKIKVFVFGVYSVIDNELHDRLLSDKKCESINQGGQCGSGILSYRALGKLQSKVNNQTQTGLRQSFNSKYKVEKITFVRDKKVSGDK